jgi:hypothetical protein
VPAAVSDLRGPPARYFSHPRPRLMGWLIAASLAGLLHGATAQTAPPLRKTDLVRLLANPLIDRTEVAQVVRRSCLTFQPTARDWQDLRNLGADSAVLTSVGECTVRSLRRTPAATAPAGSLIVTLLAPHVAAVAGTHVPTAMQVRRTDGAPVRGVTLVLRAEHGDVASPAGDVQTVTDDSGFAAFDLAVGPRPGAYRLALLSGSGRPLPGRPAIDVLVTPGPPTAVEVRPPPTAVAARPSRLLLEAPGDTALAVVVTLKDSLGNPVPHEPTELRPGSAALGIAATTQTTDSLGRATFLVRAAPVGAPGQLEVRARGATLAAIEVTRASRPTGLTTPAVPVAEAEFLETIAPHGVARSRLADVLTLAVHTPDGRPLAGRLVRFQAANATVDPDSALTDSAGQVRLDVTLGTKAGIARITAVVDSVRREDTLEVEPARAVELLLERDGQRVDRGHILVQLGVPFALTLRARDGYGNAVSAASLTGPLQKLRRTYNSHPDRLLELVALAPEGPATVLTFKPVRLGRTDLSLDVGLTTSVSIEVVPPTSRE